MKFEDYAPYLLDYISIEQDTTKPGNQFFWVEITDANHGCGVDPDLTSKRTDSIYYTTYQACHNSVVHQMNKNASKVKYAKNMALENFRYNKQYGAQNNGNSTFENESH